MIDKLITALYKPRLAMTIFSFSCRKSVYFVIYIMMQYTKKRKKSKEKDKYTLHKRYCCPAQGAAEHNVEPRYRRDQSLLQKTELTTPTLTLKPN